jgi:two-component system, OmpR family, phosphate regulon sensor histidine kinase PhoR
VDDNLQAILLDAVPLLVLAGLHGLVSLALLVPLARERGSSSWLGLGIWLLFTLVAGLAATLGILRLEDNDVLGEVDSWLVIAGAAAAAVPALIVLARRRERSLLVTAGRRVLEAEELATERGREADAISRLSDALSRAVTGHEAAELLFDALESVLGVDTFLLASVDEEEREARGFAARGVDESWWREIVLDLDEDVGAIVTVARERTPYAVYDVATAPNINRRLAEAVGAKSAAFVPLISEGRVAGVVVSAAKSDHRHFSPAELELVQGLASEAALALGRTRSDEALHLALERERLVAAIGRKVRSELDLGAVLKVAVEETAKAVGVSRSFIRLGDVGEPAPILAEWHAAGLEPVGSSAAGRLPASNLAVRERRTVAVGDVATAPELEDATLGGRSTLLDLGTQAVLATPILVFDRLVGVFGLHRPEPSRWTPGEVSLAEAVARELGLAIHTARLLGENERQLRQQATLLDAAQVLTSDLRFESVISRLVEEVVALTRADAADCWIFEPDRKLLRCRAVVGVPEWNVGRQIPPEGTFGKAIETGRTVLTHDFAQAEQPPPSPPYAVFSDVMVAPVTWLGESRGVLGVCARQAGRFDRPDVEMLEAFARFASLALHNAESFEERGRQAQVQRGFYRVAEVLSSPLSLEETFNALAQAACEALGGASALVLEPRAGNKLVLAGSYELPQGVRARFEEGVPGSLGPFTGPAEADRILSSSALAEDDRFDTSIRRLFCDAGYGSLLCAPVAGTRGQTNAVVVLFSGGRTFTDDDLALTRHLSGAARGALERSEFFEAERRASTFSQRLARVSALLATNLDPGVVLDEVVREAPALLDADAALIRLLDRDELVVRAAAGPGTGELLETRSSSAAGISGVAAQSRSPLAVEDAREQPRLSRGDALLERKLAGCLAVPMTAHGGGLYGVMAVYSREPRAWREDETQALVALAATASASVANAELYQRVAEEKERSEAILAHIADGIVAVDRADRIVLWNAMAEQITGVPASEALGRRVLEVLQRDLAGDGAEAPGERQVSILRGGKEVWLSLTEAVMLDPANAVGGRIFAFRDVSSERVVEQMKSDFVSTVSHELRTPLTSIYGFAETLMRSDVAFSEQEQSTFLGYIASESERLIRIVDDLLNVARLEAGTLGLTLSATDVGEVARETLARVGDYSGNGHRFAVEIEPGALLVRADREKLAQILLNLVDNAVKFSPDGGSITIAARRRTDTAEISVTDEGMGIDRADQQRIFMKFFRTERVARSGAEGTGLGLFLARGLLAAMGGRIWVESQEGQGASFTFELPLARPAGVPELEAAARQ